MASPQCDATLFGSENRLFDDGCFASDREAQSKGVSAYGLARLRPADDCGTAVSELAACHPNLRFRNGYGNTSACAIDNDSASRYGSQYTNPKQRQCLPTRVFHGHAHFEKGVLLPDQESELIHSNPTRDPRPCGVLSGVTIDRFVPLVPCIRSVVQNADTAVPEWRGENTRAFVQDEEYLRRCGFSHDGRGWRRS
jgi:hypothetical protein